MDKKIEKLYKFLRVLIYSAPVILIIFGAYIILFPNEIFHFDSAQPNASKFEIQKNQTANLISFGVYPLLQHRYINLNIDTKETPKSKCAAAIPKIILRKTHQAFLDPVGEQITSGDQLKQYLFDNNSSDYPNGTLLHSKATDEVFLLTKGEKILFPGPEIFRAFGYSFDNLTDVDQATLEQFPDSELKVYSWSMPHPDDTIFEAYPSHKIYLIADGQKHEIVSKDILDNVWVKNYTIPVNDSDVDNTETCDPKNFQSKDGNIRCQMDSKSFSQSFGGFYYFTLEYPGSCSVGDIHIDTADINLISEKSFASAKNSIQNIFSSILNRYFRG